MSNPAGGDSKQQLQTNNAMGQQYNAQAGQANSELFPFLSNELTNPTGFGDDTVSKMKTESGDAIAGAQGQATEAAQLLGSRTGNTAVAPGIIGASTRDAMKARSANDLGIDVENAKAKMGQQQMAAGGLGSTYSTDVNAALHALGLANDSIKTEGENSPGVGWSFDKGLSFHA